MAACFSSTELGKVVIGAGPLLLWHGERDLPGWFKLTRKGVINLYILSTSIRTDTFIYYTQIGKKVLVREFFFFFFL